MSAPVRVGVIGTSWFADTLHLPALKSHPRAHVAAVCGRDRARAEERAAKYGIPQVFTDYRQMIAEGDLQAVVVVAPDDLHFPMTMAALDAGLHVLCEKPLALRAAQARAMREKAEAAGVVNMVFFTFRGLPLYRYVRQLLDQGYIGRCRHAQIRYLANYGPGGRYSWRFDRRRANGILGDLGSHMIDLAHWYVGDIVRVGALLSAFIDRPGPDGQPQDPANDAAALAVEFADGAQGMIQASAVALVGERGLEQRLALHGDDGTLEVDFSFSSGAGQIRGVRRGETAFGVLEVPEEVWGDADRNLLLDPFFKQSVGPRLFLDSIVEGRRVAPTFADGYRVQAVIEAAIQSNEEGIFVRVG